jgi:4-amino-4-deoxy-L-arabinose transferase-like glycosyltransferase
MIDDFPASSGDPEGAAAMPRPSAARRMALSLPGSLARSLAAWISAAFDAALNGAERSGWRAYLLVGAVAVMAALPGLVALPPTDRDEARFIQASRQMEASGDLVDIRFQDEPRWKKPAGIYWAQAGSVAVASAVLGRDVSGAAWPYRLPSALGAVAAAMGALWALTPLLGRRAATLAGLITATALIVAAEATIAKTDAALLGVVTLAMGAYLRLLALARPEAGAVARDDARRLSLLFWALIGVGALLKGPIVLIPPFGAALFLCVVERRLRPLAAMGWRWGPLIAVLIAAPWYVAIGIRSDGGFFQEALVTDLVGKLAEGKESHGAPPGTYLAILWAIFWPWAPLLLAAAPWLWRARRRPEALILMAWAVPTWVAFELTPTKLPHYVLPALPALAGLVALWLTQGGDAPAPRWRRIAPAALFAVVGGALALAAMAGPALVQLAAGQRLDLAGAGVAAVCGALALWPLTTGARAMAAGAWPRAVGPALAASLLLLTAVLQGALPALGFGFPSVGMARAAAPWAACTGAPPATISYREPSLVFLQGRATRFLDDAGAAAYLATPGALVWVEDRRRPAFDAALAAHPGLAVRERAAVTAFNPNRGKTTTLRLLGAAGDASLDACAAR